ncbi:PREDICTED: uncharacterized protein LOC105564129 isoform X7 [Vollenhovia emeryi]|uniref:uncharacterized protein LOC105564129 isoform X7 n=1 Tax=Vollenhovia emeryi TaxID=411798 RepID=UPI0005F5439F|nr:PREDICTED: uncharacterized protein LOC105564129 isoform X7 [Vollenhovia emeryi]
MLRTLDVELKQTRMLSNFLREYNINRLFLSTVGFWPFQSKHLRNSLRIFSFLLEISYCPFEILLLYDHWDDAQMIFEGCYQNLISMYLIVNQLNEFWNHDKFRQLYKIIDEHWNIFTNDKEIQILKEYSTLSRIFTKYYFISLYIMLLIFTTIPLTPLLLDIVMPLNESRPRFFALVAEYRICRYVRLITASSFVSHIISCYNRYEFAWNAYTLCKGSTERISKIDVYNDGLTTEWYNFSPRLKSLLIITLYRSSVPCGLKVGNMIPLSITTYTTVSNIPRSYKFIYSFITTLRVCE